jgi:hypothetical protein
VLTTLFILGKATAAPTLLSESLEVTLEDKNMQKSHVSILLAATLP